MKKHDFEYDIEKTLKKITFPDDETVEQIAKEYPALDDAAKERILKLCERKMGVGMKNDNIKMNSNESHDTIVGVEKYKKPKWYRHIIPVAASLVLVAGVGFGISLINNDSENAVTPATQATDTSITQASFKAVICEEESDGNYIVKPVEGEDELKSSDKFSIQAESGMHQGELININYDGYIQAIYPASIKETSVERIVTESPEAAAKQYLYAENSNINFVSAGVGQYNDAVTWQYNYSPLREQFGLSGDFGIYEVITTYTTDGGNEFSEVMVVSTCENGFRVIDRFTYAPHDLTGTVTEVLEIANEGFVQYYMVKPEDGSEEVKVYSYARYGSYLEGNADMKFNVGDMVTVTYNGELEYGKTADNRTFSMALYGEVMGEELLESQREAQLAFENENISEEWNQKIEQQQASEEIQNMIEEAEQEAQNTEALTAELLNTKLNKLFQNNLRCAELFLNTDIETEGGAIDGESIYHVAPSQFENYEAFREYIYSVYCDNSAEIYLTSTKFNVGINFPNPEKPLYFEYEGKLCIDYKNAHPGHEIIFDWSQYNLEIVDFNESTCTFTVTSTMEPYFDGYTTEESCITCTAYLEDGEWRLEEMYYK